MDRRGSFAICAIARPFTNIDQDGDVLDWIELELTTYEFIVGYKVYDGADNLIASDNHNLNVLGASLISVAASALVLTSMMTF